MLLRFIIPLFFLSSCKEKVIEFSENNCKQNPAFIASVGYNPSKSYLSTSEERVMGLQLIESEMPGNPQARVIRKYQHPSWRKAGWLASITLDEKGNIYTSPAPFINILDNPIANNNTIYKVDNATGEMNEFLKLPFADSINIENPYGIIGMAYLCESQTLYVSSVAGSKRHTEKGNIYAVNAITGKIIDKITNVDAMGMGINYKRGKRELYYGSGRSSNINVIQLTASGKFSGTPTVAFSIANLGPRGDDKVRKIKTDQFGNLIVYGVEFNFNLIAPREKQETIYLFRYNEEEDTWWYSP
ncbi:MAG: hypothetical protein RIR12_1360 [Bacteroidota bacterium]|jgi:hypothetical protein